MARLRQRLRRTAAAVSAALMLTAVPMPALTASAAEPVLRMNLIGGGSVIGIGWQLEAPDGLSGYSVTLDGKKVRPEADGTFSSYDYAMDMTKPHTVTVSKGGRQVLKKEASVCSYLNSLLADSTYSEYFPVAEAMLIYGGAAQEYFGVDTEHLASEGIDSTAALNLEIPEFLFDRQAFEDCFEEAGSVPVKYTGMNLALQSEVRFSLFFEATGTAAEAERYLRSCTVGGEPAEITPYGENGWRMSRTVNVKDLDKTLRFEEETRCGVEVRPVQYLTLAEETGDEALIRVCKALYNYAIVAKRAASPIRSIELKKDYFWHWMVSENHAYMWSADDLQALMLGEDSTKEYELSVPEQLCLERTDKTGQTVKIPVLDRQQLLDWNYDRLSFPDWCQPSDYEETEKLLCSISGDRTRESRVSAKYEQDDEKDVLLLFVTLYELAGSSALQSLQLDENGKLTVSISYLEAADYTDGEYVDAYRLEFPKGTFSGEYIPEDDGGQQPEDDAVIRDIELDTDYYYDVEKMYDCGSGMFDEVDPDSEMLVKDPEAFRASLPETLVIEKTDGTGKTVQIPVLMQDRAADAPSGLWAWGYRATAPDWLKKEDYKAAERTLCDPMVGMQRVSARLEQGEETDVLLLYFTWNFMDGDLELRNLKFDENGKLTVGVSFCRTTQFGWGEDIYAYRLMLPHGALSGEWKPEDTGEGQTEAEDAIQSLELKIDLYYDSVFETTSFYDWDTQQTETTAEVRDYKAFKESLPDKLTIEKTDGSGQTVQIPVTVFSSTIDGKYDYREQKYDWNWSGYPEFRAYEAAEASLVSQTVVLDAASGLYAHVSAKLEPGEETDTLWLFFPMGRAEGGGFGIQGIRLDENGRMTVSAAVYFFGCDTETVLEVCRLELPHGALSFDAGESGGDETEPAVTTATESVSETTETTAVTEETEAQPPIRSIELKTDRFRDWMVVDVHHGFDDSVLSLETMLGEDDTKKYELSIPEQLCLERTDKTGQTVKIPVLNRNYYWIESDYDWRDTNNLPAWLKQSDYEEAEKLLSSNSENWEYWSHVSAKYEQDDEKDVLLLFVTLYELLGSSALQNLQLDENGKLTVNTSYLEGADYSGEEIDAYRLEFPKGTLSGEYIPEDSGEQQPEDDAVIRDIELDTDYYYDVEEMNANSWWTSVEPDAEMLEKDPEAFRASLPETLVIEKTDGTGKTVQIPVLMQDRADNVEWFSYGHRNPAPDWLKKEDYKAAEKALCDPMFGMQRVSARLEQGDGTDFLLLYFTWNFMSGELELRNLKFDANGKLTVGVSFCRTTEYGWGDEFYAYRLELPHGALSFDAGESGGDETEPAVTTATESVSETTETTAVTEETEAQPPIRSIELKKDYFCDWMVVDDHHGFDDSVLSLETMLGEDDTKKYELSIPEQLCLERTDKAGQTVKIPVLNRKYYWIESDYDWRDTNNLPAWLKQSDYEEAEKLLSSNSENWEYWSHVSAKYEQDDEKDVLLLFVTLYELVGSSALQSLQLDENGTLTVNTSYLDQADYGGEEVVDAYRLEFPKGTFSGEYIPEDSGEQQPEDDAVIRDIELDTEYYYDLEKMYDCGSGMFDEVDPDSEMLVKDPEAFRASLPETLVIEKTDGTGKTVQIPVLKQDRADNVEWFSYGHRNPAPDWLKKEDYKAAEKALCDPMFGMQRVSARLEQGEETDVLLLYFTWNFMDGDLELRNLKFDENGKLTVGVSFCRTTEYGWGDEFYAYRLELPHGALSFDAGESGGDETEPVIRKVSGGYTYLPDTSSYIFDPNQEEMWWESYTPETLKEYLIEKHKERNSILYSKDMLHLENTDASGETKKYYVRGNDFTSYDLTEFFGWDGAYQSDSLREFAPSWMTQADFDALDEMFDSHDRLSARVEQCGDKDVLMLYHDYFTVDGEPCLRNIRFENGTLSVLFSTEGWAPDFGEEILEIDRLEFPAGAFSGSAEPDADRTIRVDPPVKKQPDIRSVDLEIGRYSKPYWLYLEQEDWDVSWWGLRFPVLDKQTATLGKELDFSSAPEWLKQEDYEAAEAALVSGQASDPDEPTDSFRVSAKFERGEDVDVLYLYFTADAADGSLDISSLYLDRDGKLRVSARFCGESDDCSTGLYAFRLEFPAGEIC